MKIVYAITKGNWGGAQKYVFDLATAAQEAGHEVSVVYAVPRELITRLQQAGVQTIALPPTPREVKLGADFRAYQAFKKILLEEQHDVVHLNSSKIGGIGAAAARSVGIRKIIFTAHGWAFNEKRPMWQRALIWVTHYVTLLLCTKVICNSEATKFDARHMPFVQKKFVVIHNGIDTNVTTLLSHDDARTFLLSKVPEQVTHAVADARWIGTIGELHPVKNTDVLVRAFAALQPKEKNLILMLIGDGERRAALEELAKECDVYERVIFFGHVVDAGHYLRALDLFVFPSHSEALGVAALEAGVAQLPVVATNVGGIPEIIIDHKTGLLVPPDAIEPLTQAVLTLLENQPLSDKLALALHQKVMTDFSKQDMVSKTLLTYAF